MYGVVKRVLRVYSYPKRFNLSIHTFITYVIIRKLFGSGFVCKYLNRVFLGRIEFVEVLKNTKGRVLHVGACRAEEATLYQEANLGAIFIEANPSLEQTLKRNLVDKSDMQYIIALVMDVPGKEIEFNISNNIESSSALKFSKLANGADSLWPDLDLKMTSTVTLQSTTINCLIESGKLKIDGLDHIVIDIQGTELKCLRGMPRKLLEQASYITLEASTVVVYEGQDLFDSIQIFLADFGYKPMWRPVVPHGDVTFKRF